MGICHGLLGHGLSVGTRETPMVVTSGIPQI